MTDPSPAQPQLAPSPRISIVMPAYNEADILDESVHEVVTGMRDRALAFEVLVVENGSSDGTRSIADRLAASLEEVRSLFIDQADYGLALRHGFLRATGDVVVNFDVDFTDLGFLDRAVNMIRAEGGPDIVVGTKRGAGADDRRPPLRRLVTWTFSTLLRYGFGLQVSDTHGIKAMRRVPLAPIAERCEFGTDLFDTELILRGQRAGLRPAELPVVVNEKRPARSSIVRRIPRTLANLARLRVALWRRP